MVGDQVLTGARIKKLCEQLTPEIHIRVPPEKVLQRDESVVADVKHSRVALGDGVQHLLYAIQGNL